MASLDARIHPYRTDIAAETLRGHVNAPKFVTGQALAVTKGVAPLRKSPSITAPQLSEMRFGDRFTSYEHKDGWYWGQCERDGYVGYVRDDGFSAVVVNPTHCIKKLTSFLFPEASIKSPPLDTLTFFSGVEVVKNDGKFAELKSGGFVHAHHLTPISDWAERDLVFNAGRMLGVPYLWGGNTPKGLDCSGLIQLACEAVGVVCPRDSDMQAAALGKESPNPSDYHRGDIIFFPGHVGIMTDQTALLHANAHHGCVVVEPLADVVARGDKITGVRRLA
ncbi:MAG: C40 family peptidase [Alphaproteobacteria bacterium]|nr:C40 family peptidase [Alphaproteobacteria bacterium]